VGVVGAAFWAHSVIGPRADMTTAIAKLRVIDRLMVLTRSFPIAVDFVPRTDYTRFLAGRPNTRSRGPRASTAKIVGSLRATRIC
jgi:hypothetical protein